MKKIEVNLFNKAGELLSQKEIITACYEQYRKAEAQVKADQDSIRTEVIKVFKKTPGAKLNSQFVEGQVMLALGIGNENFSAVQGRIRSFLQSNSGTREEGKLFGRLKGRNGGTFLWEDQKDDPQPES